MDYTVGLLVSDWMFLVSVKGLTVLIILLFVVVLYVSFTSATVYLTFW
jgi:hypothetical protein